MRKRRCARLTAKSTGSVTRQARSVGPEGLRALLADSPPLHWTGRTSAGPAKRPMAATLLQSTSGEASLSPSLVRLSVNTRHRTLCQSESLE
jgi:hypothetical protein